MKNNWYVYIVRCADNSLYTGITKNIEKRIKKHNSGKGAKYTKTRLPVVLCCFWSVENRSIATKIEIKIKRLQKKVKETLINTDCNILEYFDMF